MKYKAEKVPVQKGPINPAPQTSKCMSYPEKVSERQSELNLLRSNQTLGMEIPRI